MLPSTRFIARTGYCIACILITLFAASQFLHAQNPTWDWANGLSCSGSSSGSQMAQDPQGNTYVIGSYSGSTATFGTTVLTPQGGFDAFLVKYDPDGNVLWATSYAGTGADRLQKILFHDSKVYVVLWSDSPTLLLGSQNIYNDYVNYIALLEVNAGTGGTFDYKQFEGDISEDVYLTANPVTSHLFLAGGYTDDLIIGGLTIPNVHTNLDDVFLVEMNGTSLLTHKEWGGTGVDQAKGLACDAVGNTYLLTNTRSASIQMEVNSHSLIFPGGVNYIISRWDASGTARMERVGGVENTDVQMSMTAGYPYEVVNLIGTCNSKFEYEGQTVTGAGGKDIFLVSYNGSGNALFGRLIGGAQDESNPSITTSPNGDIYFGGDFNSPSFNIGTTTITRVSSTDLFIAKMNAFTQDLWAKSIGGTGIETLKGLGYDNSGNLFASGSFSSSAITLGPTTLANAGASDTYIAKLDDAGNFTGATSILGTGQESLGQVFMGPDHALYLTGSFNGPSITCDTITVPQSASSTVNYFVGKLTSNFVGADEAQSSVPGWRAFPNPWIDQLNLETALPVKNATLCLVDQLGREVLTLSGLNGSQFGIKRGNLAPGFYLLQLRTAGGSVASKKILVGEE